jgi:arsenite methyltransferase
VRQALQAKGITHVGAASAFGSNYRVSHSELERLLSDAGFSGISVASHTFVDDVQGIDDLFAWSSSSSFGNFLSDLTREQRGRIRDRLGVELERRRGPSGIQLQRHLVFGTARR